MHTLKEIRKDFPSFEKALEKRSIKIDFKKIQNLDEENRDLIQKKEAIEIVEIFLNTEFEGGRHERRVNKINKKDS